MGVTAGVFTVLFATGFAAVALSSVWGETEFEEVIALAVWAGQGDGDWHGDILTPPTTSARAQHGREGDSTHDNQRPGELIHGVTFLARMAAVLELGSGVIDGGWLHRHGLCSLT